MRRTMGCNAFAGTLLLLGMSCTGATQKPVGGPPVAAPRWVPFNAPQSTLKLPSFMVGEQGELSSGCWTSASESNVDSLTGMKWDKDQQKQFDSNVQATFSKYLLDVGLDASLASSLTQRWTLEVGKLSFTKVDPATIRANFGNGACTTKELGWFADKRFVVTAAVKADTVKIRSTTAISSEQKAKLDAAIDKINAKFHADFHNLRSAGENLELDATNVFIGGMGTTLVADECAPAPFDIAPNASVAVCGGKYTIKVSPSTVGDRYTFSVTPADGSTANFDDKFGEQQAHQLNELRIVRALVDEGGTGRGCFA